MAPVETLLGLGPAVAGTQDGVQMMIEQLGTGDEGGHLLLFDHLPVDELLDVGMIEIEDDHLGGPAGGAARLDGAGGPVADLEEAHQAARFAAAGKRFAVAAQGGEVGAGAAAVLEDAGLAHPQVHDAAVVDQVVGYRLDEAGVRRGPLVSRGGAHHLAAVGFDVAMSLRRAFDAVGPVQAGVEPLRRVGRGQLRRQHVAGFVEEGPGVGLAGEVAAPPTPVGPASGQAAKNLPGVCLLFRARIIGKRPAALQPDRHARLGNAFGLSGHAGLAEVLLSQDVHGDLRPSFRRQQLFHLEDDRAVRIDYPRGARHKRECSKRILSLDGITASNVHSLSSFLPCGQQGFATPTSMQAEMSGPPPLKEVARLESAKGVFVVTSTPFADSEFVKKWGQAPANHRYRQGFV